MITLGLDPSLTGFGWCVHDSSQFGTARVIARGVQKTTTKEVFVTRYMSLRSLVNRLLDTYPQIEAVGVESPIFGATFSPGAYALFVMVNEAVFQHRKDVVYFDPSTVKSLTKLDPSVRKGEMRKSDMVEAARADTGIKGRFNHNEADAYHVARFAARFWELDKGLLTEADLVPSEKHTFLRTHTYVKGKRAGQTVKSGTVFREDDRFFRFSLVEQDPNDDPHHERDHEQEGQQGTAARAAQGDQGRSQGGAQGDPEEEGS
jgi:Holliday junction resolvasome RuvABC endonuclease subunit